jgi:hypothetical protein
VLRFTLAALALLLLVFATALFFSADNVEGGRPPISQGDARDSDEAVTDVFSLLDHAEPLRGAVVSEVGEASPATSEVAEEAIPVYGQIVGGVYDANSELMPYQRIAFVRPEGLSNLSMAREHKAYSDRDGYYIAKDIPVGIYTVLFYGKQKHSLRQLGTVEVFEGRSSYDVILFGFGERKLQGAFTIAMPEGAVPPGASMKFQLEVRNVGSDDIVAWGEATTIVSAEQARERFSTDTEDPEEVARQSRPQGHFSIGGLEPDRYTLRILLGEDREGDLIYIERDVDLFEGNVTLPAEAFTLETFFGEAELLRRVRTRSR